MKQKIKRGLGVLTTAGAVALYTLPVYASESSAITALDNSMQSVKNDSLAAITTVAPYAISVMGAFLLWRYGTRFFKSVAK